MALLITITNYCTSILQCMDNTKFGIGLAFFMHVLDIFSGHRNEIKHSRVATRFPNN